MRAGEGSSARVAVSGGGRSSARRRSEPTPPRPAGFPTMARCGRSHAAGGAPDVLVLCYHAVSDRWDAALSVTPAALRRQLASLVVAGLGRRDVHARRCSSPPAPRTLAVTFDDGFDSVRTHAAPILDELGLPATVFVPTDWPGASHALAGNRAVGRHAVRSRAAGDVMGPAARARPRAAGRSARTRARTRAFRSWTPTPSSASSAKDGRRCEREIGRRVPLGGVPVRGRHRADSRGRRGCGL